MLWKCRISSAQTDAVVFLKARVPFFHARLKLGAMPRATYGEVKSIDVHFLWHLLHHLPGRNLVDTVFIHAKLKEFVFTIILEMCKCSIFPGQCGVAVIQLV